MTEGNTNYVGSILGEERDQSGDPPPLEIDKKGGLTNIVFLHVRNIKIYLVVLFGVKKNPHSWVTMWVQKKLIKQNY